MNKLSLLAVYACLIPGSAMAAPALSGSYTFNLHTFCQIKASVNAGTGQITISKDGVGSENVTTGTITFNAMAGTFAFTGGFLSTESAIFEKFSDGSHRGNHALFSSGFSDSGTYSNTDTTLALTASFLNLSGVYGVVYDHADSGIASGFAGVLQTSTTDTCIRQIIARIQ